MDRPAHPYERHGQPRRQPTPEPGSVATLQELPPPGPTEGGTPLSEGIGMRKALFGVLATLALLPNANATPGATTGAIVFGTGAAIVCDQLVRSYMEPAPESDEPWYLVWRHVGMEDLVGLAAGTACAVPAAAAGAAVGIVVEGTLVAGSATALGTGAIIATGKGIHLAGRALASTPGRAAGYVETAAQKVWGRQGQFKIGRVARLSGLREHIPDLYRKQRGMDGVCRNIPLPPLYVGPWWNRRLNPDIEVDHRHPKAKGGTNDVSNLQATHKEFNRRKGARIGKDLERAKRRFCHL